jgi:hypothetical protein
MEVVLLSVSVSLNLPFGLFFSFQLSEPKESLSEWLTVMYPIVFRTVA